MKKKPAIQQKSFGAKPSKKDPTWFLLDAEGKTLGRLASEIAKILRGKHSPTFTPHVDSRDGVIVINAEKVSVTGSKAAQKIYGYHTGYRRKEIPYKTMMERKPREILRLAVRGMMPKTRLGKAQMKRLRLFVGAEHDMDAQKPIAVNV